MSKYEDLLKQAKQMIEDFPTDWESFCRRMNILTPQEDDMLDFLLWVRS